MILSWRLFRVMFNTINTTMIPLIVLVAKLKMRGESTVNLGRNSHFFFCRQKGTLSRHIRVHQGVIMITAYR
ncbi:hypothetical protein HanXRQr2_Chr03g0111371 [Helianthus annuus]|uniref:Uncharacterized protein n=1 Tax=Helianthus annuus TaxID=4232 RepID=A0A9K3JG49_HELAN|nr:hypothetical protein HanXRQr2_Chr03g0111371 [Helianthus annuus]KAJ0943711.1 hypothetical protein HanPSC8_Chr03g0107841 [Helianthus annuus]